MTEAGRTLEQSPRRTPSGGLLAAVWASPGIFLVHDLEEWFVLPRWLPTAVDRLPILLRDRIPGPDAYAVAFLLPFGLHVSASWGFARRPRARATALFFATVVAARLWNVPLHTAQALLLGGYVPGVVTVWIVVAPFAAWLLARLYGDGWLKRGRLAVVAVAGVLLHFAAIAASLAVGLLMTSPK